MIRVNFLDLCPSLSLYYICDINVRALIGFYSIQAIKTAGGNTDTARSCGMNSRGQLLLLIIRPRQNATSGIGWDVGGCQDWIEHS